MEQQNNLLYTNEDFKVLVETLQSITTHIPEQTAGYVWSNYKKISGSNENQPCMCGSSANHWRKAVDTCREYIKTNSDKYNA